MFPLHALRVVAAILLSLLLHHVAPVDAVVYIDCASVSCTPYSHAMVPQYDEVRVINAPVGAVFTFNTAFMNALTFDTTLSNCNIQLQSLTLFNGHLIFAQAPASCSITIDGLTAMAGVVSFTRSLGSGTSLSLTNSKIKVSTNSLLDPPHAVHIPDQTAVGTATGDITITGNAISYKHLTPAISFAASGVWIGKFSEGPPTLTISSNHISVENTRAYGIRVSPNMMWQAVAASSSVVIELNVVQVVHATQGSGIAAGAAYWNSATRLSIQSNTVTQNVTSSGADADGTEFVGIDYVFCYIKAAAQVTLSFNTVALSAASDYATGMRFEHSGQCEGLSAVKRLDDCAILDVSSNTVTVGAKYVATAIQLGAQAVVSARLALGGTTTGIATGRTVQANSNTVTVTGAHHARGIEAWLWNVEGLNQFDVSGNVVSVTQRVIAGGTTLSVAPLDGSDVRATGSGIHVAFNDRFSNVLIDRFKVTGNTVAVDSASANTECPFPRTFWYDSCWAELSAVWVRWHASRAGGYTPRGSTVYIRYVEVQSNTAAVTDAGGVFVRGVVFDHASMRDVTADQGGAAVVAYTRGAQLKVMQNVLTVASTSTAAAAGLNSTLEAGVGFSCPLATYADSTLVQNMVTITSQRMRLGGTALVAIASAYSGTVTASSNTLAAPNFLDGAEGTHAGLLVVRAGDGANADTGNTLVSGNAISVSGSFSLLVALGFVWSSASATVPLLHPLDGGTAPTLPSATPGLVASAVSVRFDGNTVSAVSTNVTASVTGLALGGFDDAPVSFALGTMAITNNDMSGTGVCDSSPRKAKSAVLDGHVAVRGIGHFFALEFSAAATITVANAVVSGNSFSFATTGSALLCEGFVIAVRAGNNVTALHVTGNTFFQRHADWVPFVADAGAPDGNKQSLLIDLGAAAAPGAPTAYRAPFLLYNNTFSGVFGSVAPPSRFGLWTVLAGARIVSGGTNVTLSHNRAVYDTTGFSGAGQPLHFSGVVVESSGALMSFDNNAFSVFGSSAAGNSATYAVTARLLPPHCCSAAGTAHAPNVTLRCDSDRFDVVSGGGQLVAALNISVADTRADSLFVEMRNLSASARGVTAQVAAGTSLVAAVFFPQNLSHSTIVCDGCYFWAQPEWATKDSPWAGVGNGWWAAEYNAGTIQPYSATAAFWFRGTVLTGPAGLTYFDTNVTFHKSKLNNWCIERADLTDRAFKGIASAPESYVTVTSLCTRTRSLSRTTTETDTLTHPPTRTRTTWSRTWLNLTKTRSRSGSRGLTQELTETVHYVPPWEPYPVTTDGVIVAVLSLLGFTPSAAALQMVALTGMMPCSSVNGTSHDMRIVLTPVWTDVNGLLTDVPSGYWLGQSFLVGAVLLLHVVLWLTVVSCCTVCHPLSVAEALDHSNMEQGDKCCVCDCGTRGRLAALRVRFPHWTIWAMQWLLPGYVYESMRTIYYSTTTLHRCIAAIGPAMGIVLVVLVFFWSWRASRAFYFGNMWVEYSRHRARFKRHWSMKRVKRSSKSKYEVIDDAAVGDSPPAAVVVVGSRLLPHDDDDDHAVSPIPPLPTRGGEEPSVSPSDAVRRSSGNNNSSGGNTPKRLATPTNREGIITPTTPVALNNNNSMGTPLATPRSSRSNSVRGSARRSATPTAGLVTPSGRVIPLVPASARDARLGPTPGSAVPVPAMSETARIRQKVEARRRELKKQKEMDDNADLDFVGGGAGCCDYLRLATLPVGYWATHKPLVAERMHTAQYGAAYDEYVPSVLPWAPSLETLLRVIVFPCVAALDSPCQSVSYPLTVLSCVAFVLIIIVRPLRSGVLDLVHALIYLLLGLSLLSNAFDLPTSSNFNYDNVFYGACAFAALGVLLYWIFFFIEMVFWRPEWERKHRVDEDLVMSVGSMNREFDEDIVRPRTQPVEFDESDFDDEEEEEDEDDDDNNQGGDDKQQGGGSGLHLIDGRGKTGNLAAAANKNKSSNNNGDDFEMESVKSVDDIDLYTDVGMDGESLHEEQLRSRSRSLAPTVGDDGEGGAGADSNNTGRGMHHGGPSMKEPDSGRSSVMSTATGVERVRQIKEQSRLRRELDIAFSPPEERRAALEAQAQAAALRREQQQQQLQLQEEQEQQRLAAAEYNSAAAVGNPWGLRDVGLSPSNNNNNNNSNTFAGDGELVPVSSSTVSRRLDDDDQDMLSGQPAAASSSAALGPGAAFAPSADRRRISGGLTVDYSRPPPAELTTLSENRAVPPHAGPSERAEPDALDRRVTDVKNQVHAARAERLKRIAARGEEEELAAAARRNNDSRAEFPEVADQAGLDRETWAKLDRIGLAKQAETRAQRPAMKPINARVNPGMATWWEPDTENSSNNNNNNNRNRRSPSPAAAATTTAAAAAVPTATTAAAPDAAAASNLSSPNSVSRTVFSPNSSTNSVNAVAAFGRRSGTSAAGGSPVVLGASNNSRSDSVSSSVNGVRVTDSLARNGITLRPGVTPTSLMRDSRRDGDADVVTFDE